jgi:hypothetical protein
MPLNRSFPKLHCTHCIKTCLRAVLLFGAMHISLVLADDFEVHGYADLRVVSAPDETSWMHGGLGKTHYGDAEDAARFGGAGVSVAWQATPQLLAFADARTQPQMDSTFGLLEAYVRYRPVSISPWRWSIKVGEFFAPISLENDATAWTSRWTITPSAINTWIGEELRTFGAEFRLEHRDELNTVEGAVAVFAANDPAGEILAARGWSLGDFVAGVGSRLREPDVYAQLLGVSPPRRYDPFLEIDHRAGFYADLDWHSQEFGRANVLYYDNRANPSDFHSFDGGDQLFAWRTHFTSVGAQTDFGKITLMAQAIAGATEIAPPGFPSETYFSAGYVLAGWNVGEWRPAMRIDAFGTRRDPASSSGLSEHGNAVTLALNWRPLEWLRVTGEALRIESIRDQRLAVGLSPRQTDTQMLLNARVLF